jgi:hypothetical protein
VGIVETLVPDFRGNGFSFSPLSMMLAIGLSTKADTNNTKINRHLCVVTKLYLQKLASDP